MENARELSIPVDSLSLHEGDIVRGVVHDGMLTATVTPSAVAPSRTAQEKAEIDAFLDRLAGKFKNPNYDPTGDPRAEAILRR